jgi:hypothetical protein
VPENLSRIPFTREEEETILSMTRWMRFMAVVGIVSGFLILFFLVLGIGVFSAAGGLRGSLPHQAELQRFLDQMGPWVYLMLGAFLVAALAVLWQNFALFHASDSFTLMARTDVADLDYLSRGLDQLRTFFKIQVLIVLVTVLTAFGTALALVAAWRTAP